MRTEASRAASARNTIESILYLTLATANRTGQPWCTPVYTAFNDKYEFFWGSARQAQHSCNIRENPVLGAMLYDSRTPLAVNNDQGLDSVYMKGIAEELTPDNCHEGLNLLRARCTLADTFFPRDFYHKDTAVRIYKFIPREFFMLIPGGDPACDVYADKRESIDIFGT